MTPCWNPEQVLRIVTPDAEEITDHVFRAVHCPTELQFADTADGSRYGVAPEALIERFLEPGRRYVQAVVIGESGTGKSHLIQWLRLNLPHSPDDLVLTIPKVGTSLRGIVERIIERLPADSRTPFEEKLRTAGTQTTTHAARVDKFLYSLAWSVQHAVQAQTSEDSELAELLPDVLSDPNLRRGFFSVVGGTVDQIVRHIFDSPDARGDQNTRRQFQVGDLPLGGEHYAHVARRAKDAIDFIRGEPGMEQRAIDLMTRALEQAIAQTLNFTADDLIGLMRSLRIFLAARGQRLILLIEDFARLQGIDTALLQALVTPSRQEEDQLCELRWAMAVTTGYFRRLEQTVRTRATFVVDMDHSQPASISQFATGYLNAIRVGDAALLAAAPGQPVPNHCASCSLKVGCWNAFGQQDGIGLFPFNAFALNSFADRTGARQDGRFNPRTFLRAVIEPVMNQHHAELAQGHFPSAALLRRVGGENRLEPRAIALLERTDPAQYDRRVSLLELWDGSGRLVNLNAGVHDAFGLPPLSDLGVSNPVQSEVPVVGPKVPPQPEPPLINAIRQWATQAEVMLSSAHVNTLRGIVFSALEGFIDWDGLGIQKSWVSNAFRKPSINFSRQQTQRARTAVSLELPLSGQSLAQTAVALEALVRSSETLHWEFEHGGEHLATVLNELQRWADDVVRQLKAIYRGSDQWDPIVGAVEVMTLALLQSGKIKVASTSEDIAAKLFERSAPSAMEAVTTALRQLNDRLVQSHDRSRELLRALCSGTKGGRVGNFVRATPMLQAIRSLRRRNLQLNQVPPADVAVQELRPLIELYGRLQSSYTAAFDSERAEWTRWVGHLRECLGGGDCRPSHLVALVNDVLTEAENAAVVIGASRETLRVHLASLPPARTLDQAFDHWAALAQAQGTEALVRCAIASAHREPVDKLLETSTAALTQLEARISGEFQQIEVDVGEGLRQSQAVIGASLSGCVAALDRFIELRVSA